ncbi:MAG: hypothetical protein RLZZ454_718 [Pseudomonadota bacterium]
MSKSAAASKQAAVRKAEVRPARVWQATDLLNPPPVSNGFVAKPWLAEQTVTFGRTNFDTPTPDLLPKETSTEGEPALEGLETDTSAEQQPETAAPTVAVNEQALAQARAEGHAQGLAEARVAMQAEMEASVKAAQSQDHALVAALQTALEPLQQPASTFYEPLKRLALHLAEQLVLAELSLDGRAIERLVQRCVDELSAHDESLVVVELNPADLALLQSLRERTGLNTGPGLRLLANDTLLPGSVRASANDAVVEDLIGNQLSALARGLSLNETQWKKQTAFGAERIISDKIASNAVEDARPRMATPSEVVAATEPTAYDTVEAIDDILREAEHHV